MARRDKDKSKDKEAKSDAPTDDHSEAETQPIGARPDDAARANPKTDPPRARTQPGVGVPRSSSEPVEMSPASASAEPWPEATPPSMNPVEARAPAAAGAKPVEDDLVEAKPAAARPVAEAPEARASRTPTATMTMPFAADVGRPPEMPRETAPPPLALGSVEEPTHLPGPKDVPAGDPDDRAPPPGRVPPGDSRSLRRGNEFALVYRVGTCVITRTGVVGTRGLWRVVEYPTSATASSSYAKECSRFVSEGFSDYRD